MERGKTPLSTPNTASRNSRPMGMAREGLSMECFFTANGGLFERPRAAFFTVAAAGVMSCMTVVMVGTMRRKTRFPTGVTTSAIKAKPPAVATAFCVFGITLYNIRGCRICHWPADLSAAVTPSANRTSYRVAILFCINTQGRGASPLNPGL